MAGKFVLGQASKGIQVKIGHDHCKTCGACFAAIPKEAHRCPQPVDMSVLEVFLLDSGRFPDRATRAIMEPETAAEYRSKF